jgi:hypothetical protein
MRLIGNLLLVICLITGCLSAATAYLTRTSSDAAVGLQLTEPAGAVEPTDEALDDALADYRAGELTATEFVRAIETAAPLVPPGTELTEEELTILRSADVEYVEIKSFALERWPYAWVFGLSALGLLAGSLLVRAGARRAIAAEGIAPERTAQLPEAEASPDQIVESVASTLETLHREMPGMSSDQERLKAVITRIGALQRDAIPRFIESRPKLVARFGLGRYAEIMDAFAAMERKINRAWSAAADGHLPESETALDQAVALAPNVREKLQAA